MPETKAGVQTCMFELSERYITEKILDNFKSIVLLCHMLATLGQLTGHFREADITGWF